VEQIVRIICLWRKYRAAGYTLNLDDHVKVGIMLASEDSTCLGHHIGCRELTANAYNACVHK
jgi:hypothetical protein